MNIYTRTGDDGTTGLIGGRAEKDALRVEANGALDEANAFIGQAVAFLNEADNDLLDDLRKVQHELFDAGADLASLKISEKDEKIRAEHVRGLEQRIDGYEEQLPPIERFILPGGTQASAFLHTARSVVRRAERAVVSLSREVEINKEVLRYLNRLSDFLFVTARLINARHGVADVEYKGGR